VDIKNWATENRQMWQLHFPVFKDSDCIKIEQKNCTLNIFDCPKCPVRYLLNSLIAAKEDKYRT
jgi:hypothetical protein